MISHAISELLFTHECVIVPGLGGFLVSYHPARIDTFNNRFFPPSGRVAFNAGLSANDGLLANYVASQKNITYKQALDEINTWVTDMMVILKQGKHVQIENIGTLLINRHHHLQFEPSQSINYNEDAFGLSVVESNQFRFRKEPLKREVDATREPSGRIRYLVAETLKWAAVLAPLAAFSLWGIQNRNMLSTAISNEAGLFSWSSATPGKTIDVVPVSNTPSVDYTKIALYPGFQASVEGYVPAKQAFANLRQAESVKQEPLQLPLQGKGQYHIVVGAFRDHSNAVQLVKHLISQGYPAAVVDTNARGLYIVSIRNLENKGDALNELNTLRNKGFEGAWLLRKKS